VIKCVIFDCDGTLVDSEVLFNRALSIKLSERGIELTADQLVSRFRGVKLTDVLNTLESQYKVTLDKEFVDDYRVLVNAFFEKELVACSGVKETLSVLGLPMCVATNGPLGKMQLALRVTGLIDFFDGQLFSAYEVGAWKPDPELFLFAAQTLGFNADECLVVEDSIVGIEAAKAANMMAVLYDPHHVHPDVDGAIKIHAFEDLLKQLGAMQPSQ